MKGWRSPDAAGARKREDVRRLAHGFHRFLGASIVIILDHQTQAGKLFEHLAMADIVTLTSKLTLRNIGVIKPTAFTHQQQSVQDPIPVKPALSLSHAAVSIPRCTNMIK
ncbi:hypothetical protein HDU77_009075 [Chytriomyces hyalinus]|nr:hypothetical protein HDU77_009075 [Chytriomyces hyalinus]